MLKFISVNKGYAQVIELLRLEASAIEHTAKHLDEKSVERAVELLLNCQSKVVVTGVGKSAIIANKIADTMTSTGTVAVFVHSSDALHGSLGVIGNGDVVIALSNSGETEELLAILPSLKQRSVKIISIVGNLNSTLARQSDVVLDASVDQEACPLNLAPTTSTTVALSLGDALAMTVSNLKGWTEDDFAANHPAGRLGKRLTLKVSDLMHESPNPTTAAPGMLAYDALLLMENRPRQISVLPVVADGKSCGLLRLHDIVRSGL